MIKYSVYLNGKSVTPDEVRERLDANEGKCQFMLLPSGELRLRVYNDDHYSFFPLPSAYEVRLYAVEDPLTTDLRQRVETLTKALEEAKDFIGRLPVKYDVIPGVGYAMKSNMYPVLRVLGTIDHALKSDNDKSAGQLEKFRKEICRNGKPHVLFISRVGDMRLCWCKNCQRSLLETMDSGQWVVIGRDESFEGSAPYVSAEMNKDNE